MGGPYSDDLRRGAVTAVVTGGASCRSVAGLLGIGVSSVIRWVARFRATGSYSRRAMGRSRGVRIAGADREWLLAKIASAPDSTLEELRRALAARGLSVGYGTVWRFCAREAQTFKKKPARRATRPARRGARAGALAAGPGRA